MCRKFQLVKRDFMEKTVLTPAPLTVRLANTQTVFVRVLRVGKGTNVLQVA